MFVLQPTRAYPRRYRSTDLVQPVTGSFRYYNSDGSLADSGELSAPSGVTSYMYDVEHGASVNDCVHQTTTYEAPTYSGKGDCELTSWYEYDACPGRVTLFPAILYPMEDVLKHPHFQRAAEKLAERYHSQIYRMNPEQLPDMTVFLAELRELSGIFSIIYDIAKKIIWALRRIRLLKRRIKRARRLDKPKVAKRMVRDAKKGIAEYESKILGWRFGVMAPIRDMTKLIAAMYGYVDTLKFRRAPMHFREQFHFEAELGDQLISGCHGFSCPDFPEHYPGGHSVCDVKGYLSISSVVLNRLEGSPLEKTIALLLGQLGMMPNLGTLWELTHLSWLVDYFYTTSSLIRRLERHAGLSPLKPVVEDTCIGLSITRRAVTYDLCARQPGGACWGPGQIITDEYYERLVTKARDFEGVISKLHLPSPGMQTTNAVAFLTTLLLSR